MRALSSRPLCPCDDRQVSLGDLSAAYRYTTKRIGTVNITTVKDADGKEYGKEMLTVVSEGAFKEVAYKFPRPGETTPSQKSTFVTKVGTQLCGVGYYK
jgi:hypothetical protein